MTSDLTLSPEDAALLARVVQSAPVELDGMPKALGRYTSTTAQFTVDLRWRRMVERIEAHAALVPAPLNGDKVWGGLTVGLVHANRNGNQARTIVRAKTKAEAVRLLNAASGAVSASRFNDYWRLTRNREELALVKEKGVWAQGAKGWVKVWPK